MQDVRALPHVESSASSTCKASDKETSFYIVTLNRVLCRLGMHQDVPSWNVRCE